MVVLTQCPLTVPLSCRSRFPTGFGTSPGFHILEVMGDFAWCQMALDAMVKGDTGAQETTSLALAVFECL